MGATIQNYTKTLLNSSTYNVQIDSSNSQNGMSDIHVNVDTTLGAVNLVLPPIRTFGNAYGNIKLTVFDKGGASATNPITITPSITVPPTLINNAASVVLGINKGVLEVEVVDEDNWNSFS